MKKNSKKQNQATLRQGVYTLTTMASIVALSACTQAPDLSGIASERQRSVYALKGWFDPSQTKVIVFRLLQNGVGYLRILIVRPVQNRVENW